MIGHYYWFLLETLDGNVISRLMLDIKLLTEDDLVHCAKMCTDHQKNAFLNKLIVYATYIYAMYTWVVFYVVACWLLRTFHIAS